MIHFLRVFAALGLLGLAESTVSGQDAAGMPEELRQLRKTVDQQSKQIEMLTREVARLGAAIEGKETKAPAPASSGSPGSTAKTEESGTAAPPPASEDF